MVGTAQPHIFLQILQRVAAGDWNDRIRCSSGGKHQAVWRKTVERVPVLDFGFEAAKLLVVNLEVPIDFFRYAGLD